MRIAIALMLVAPAAWAEELETSTTIWPDRGVGGAASLSVEASTRTGSGVAVGVEGRFGAERGCGVLASGGVAAVRVGPAPVTVMHWASACVPTWRVDEQGGLDVTFLPLELEHRLAIDAVPRLASRRFVWSEPYTQERLEIRSALMSVDRADEDFHWAIVPAPFRVNLDWLWQPGQTESRHGFGFDMVGMRQPDGGLIRLFGGYFEADFWRVDLFAIDDVRLGDSGLLLDLALGSGDTLRYVDGMFARSGGLTGRLGLGFARGALRAAAAIEQDYYQTIDDAVVGDARAEVEVHYERGRWAATGSAFRSRAQLIYTDGSGQLDFDPAFGAELAVAFPIARRLDGRVGGGWARSFYGRLSNAAPTVEPAFELAAQVVAQLGKPRRR